MFRIAEVAPVSSPSRILCSQIGACTSGMEQLHHLHLITSTIRVVEGSATIQRPRLHLGVQVTVWYRNCMEISRWVEVVSLKSVYPYTPPQKKTHIEENPSIVRQFHRYLRFSSVESPKKHSNPITLFTIDPSSNMLNQIFTLP